MAEGIFENSLRPMDDTAPEFEQIAEAARFPAENPNPVFRVAADGRLLYANRSSKPLLAAWGVVAGGCVPALWRERFAGVLAGSEARSWDAQCEDRLLQLQCVPILGGGYVNVYGADVTERAALLAQVSEQARRAEKHAAELEATLDAITDGVMIYGPDRHVLHRNAAAGQTLGYAAADYDLSWEERVTRLGVELVSEPAAGTERLPTARALAGETVRGELMRLRPANQPDAEPRFVLASAAPIRDPSGALLGAVASFSDVTELHRTRDELARRVQELEALLELLPVGIAISYDPECKDIRVNPAQARALGMAPDANVSLGADESRERPPYRVFDQTGRELAVEELPMQAAAGSGTEVRDMVVDILHDGARVTMLSYATPLLDGAGKPRGAVAAFVDISGLRAAEIERERLLDELRARSRELEAQANEIRALNVGLEERVRARTAELEAIFAAVPDSLYVANASGILRCNQAALDGFGCESIEELREMLPFLVEKMQARYADTGEVIAGYNLALARALRGERIVLEALTRNPRTNEDQVYRVAAGPIVLNGEIVAAVAHATDITERKAAEARAARLVEQLSASREQLQALSRRLVTMQESERSYVADQLYNQAGQVLAALQMQLSRLGREGGRESPAEQLPRMLAMLQEAIGELHDLARELRPVGLDRSTLGRVLGSYLTEFGKAHGLAVRFRPGAAETLRVPADVGTAIFRCVQEGLTNVARHARASEVTLSLAVDGGDLVVTLADNGVGFGAAASDREQVGLDGDAERGGWLGLASSLGLAAIRERLEIVGGQLTILTGRTGTTLTMHAPIGAAI